jgi:hypothetical protein
MMRHPALRRPCGTHVFGNPAADTCLRNQSLKLFLPNGRPHSLVRNVSDSGGLGQASIAAVSGAGTGVSTFLGLRLRFFSWVNTSHPSLRCWWPSAATRGHREDQLKREPRLAAERMMRTELRDLLVSPGRVAFRRFGFRLDAFGRINLDQAHGVDGPLQERTEREQARAPQPARL